MGPYDILYTIINVILTHLTEMKCIILSTGTWELSFYLLMSFEIYNFEQIIFCSKC